MSRMTQDEKNQIIEVFYGIDPLTFEVPRISLTRGNILKISHPDGRSDSHPLHTSALSAQDEITVVWSLTDIISVLPGTTDPEHEKQLVSMLETKAQEMKRASEP